MATRSALGWVRLLAVPVLGVLAIVAGLVVLRSQPASFGWFAYAPLSDTVFVPSPTPWYLGVALVLLGVAALAGWVGFLLGRRRRG